MIFPSAATIISSAFLILCTDSVFVNAGALSRPSRVTNSRHEPVRRLIPVGQRALGKRSCAVRSSSSGAVSNVASVSAGANIGGLAWNNNPADSMSNFAGGDVTWYYTWSPWYNGGGQKAGLNFAPMLWNAKQLNDFNQNKGSFKANGVTHILGFNEPNETGQANMTPKEAITLWISALMPMRTAGFKLVSPACSSSDNAISWYQQFLGGLTSAQQPDVIAIHWYGNDVNAFIAYVKNIHSMFGKNIWITEYACQNFGSGAQCTSAEVYNFMKTALTFLRHTPWVEREAWFGSLRDMAGVNQLDSLWATTTVGDSTLSDIGWLYAYGNV